MPWKGFQNPAWTETGGGPSGPPFFMEDIVMPSKPFLNYDEQVNNLIENKNLIILDTDYAKSKLKEIGYFTLIGGYKKPIKNLETRLYYDGVKFDDVFRLYNFDNDLRELSFRYISKVEIKLRSCLSYAFCEEYGSSQSKYLDKNNYVYSDQDSEKQLNKLLNTMLKRATESSKDYIEYQRKVHGEIPFWAILNSFPFGTLLTIYNHLPQSLQTKISKNFPNVKNSKELGSFLYVVKDFRNACAHNEQLYLHISKMHDIPDTILHQKMNIEQNGTQYIYGKNDYFSLVVSFRYLLTNEESREYKKLLLKLISSFLDSSEFITKENLYPLIGFPKNWENICRYKM